MSRVLVGAKAMAALKAWTWEGQDVTSRSTKFVLAMQVTQNEAWMLGKIEAGFIVCLL